MRHNQKAKIRITVVPLVMVLLLSCGDTGKGKANNRAPGLPYSPTSYSITLMEAKSGWKVHNLSISPNGVATAEVEDPRGTSLPYKGQAFVGGSAASVNLIKMVSGYEEYLPPVGVMLNLSGTIRPGCFYASGAFLSSYEDNTIFLNIKWGDLPDVAIHWGSLKITDKVALEFPPC